MSRLAAILATKAAEVEFRKRVAPSAVVEDAARRMSEPIRDFAAALRAARTTPAAIAEIKRASPSKGLLRAQVDVAALAKTYTDAGAAALSILTDHTYFGGDSFDLTTARANTPLPVLRKDFIIDEYQVYESRLIGADAILLIVAALAKDRLQALHRLAADLGLAVVVEVHSERELEVALKVGPAIVGVNARNLANFSVDVGVVERILPRVPATLIRVGESGVRARDDVTRMAAAGAEAVLIGEKLMTAKDPGAELRALIGS
ncbi:MAG: indole-3-glycerol phosphate synthase TrpC [Deltaproteobacteria bacterium]|nr:indole-3-glycerol phosphate synthase TrpC [Deltaproteobacteria bacterium]